MLGPGLQNKSRKRAREFVGKGQELEPKQNCSRNAGNQYWWNTVVCPVSRCAALSFHTLDLQRHSHVCSPCTNICLHGKSLSPRAASGPLSVGAPKSQVTPQPQKALSGHCAEPQPFIPSLFISHTPRLTFSTPMFLPARILLSNKSKL